MDAYAGYYIEERKIMESSSGGAVTAISEEFIRDGGLVYGVSYSQDFYSAVYECSEKEETLMRFRGSKYIYVNKNLEENRKKKVVYEDVMSKLNQGFKVLFVGLGCDIAAIKRVAQRKKEDIDKLFTIELLCDGVTNDIVQKEYVTELEKLYRSRVTEFNVRHKAERWIPPYIYVKFENGKEHIEPFHESDYGYAFVNYKKKACYHCCFKGEKHQGDIIAGDFWGCEPGMEGYNEKGVSLLLVPSIKGNILLNSLSQEKFYLKEIDKSYALYNNPRYYTSHAPFFKWERFDKIIKERGLREAVRDCVEITMPERFKSMKIDELILWGTGTCFRQYISLIQQLFPQIRAVDSNSDKWGGQLACGLICENPNILKRKKNFFVLIMIEDTSAAFQVVNRLLDMNITEFDYIKNWLNYRKN